MPKQTFYSIEEGKRKRIVDAFLIEFSTHTYDDASVSNVVRKLEIAKGSIYQYFEDKLDVFKYLIGECVKVKMAYIGHLAREDYDDFWTYFRELYIHGCHFDRDHPKESHFLHSLTQNLNSPSVKDVYNEMLQQTVAGFEAMIRKEITLGLFRDDQSVETMAYLLYKVGVSIMEQLELQKIIDPQESISKGIPVFQEKEALLLATVDHYINLIKPSFNK